MLTFIQSIVCEILRVLYPCSLNDCTVAGSVVDNVNLTPSVVYLLHEASSLISFIEISCSCKYAFDISVSFLSIVLVFPLLRFLNSYTGWPQKTVTSFCTP